MQTTGNKQDWAGVYVLLKLLSDGYVTYGKTDRLCPDKEQGPISNIIRQDESGTTVYSISPKTILSASGDESTETARNRCEEVAILIFDKIKHSRDEVFEIPETSDILHSLHYTSFHPVSEDNSDLTLTIHLPETGSEKIIPLVVKTAWPFYPLMKANRAANLKYEILNIKLSNPESNKINRIDGPMQVCARLDEIARLGGKLKFTHPENKIYLDNLSMTDLHFPRLLAGIVHTFYNTGNSCVAALTKEIKSSNPFKIREELITKNNFYEYKIKQFLYSLASGMRPAKIYRGYGFTPGFLFVTPLGELLFYDPADRKNFDEMLFHNTRLSIPDCDAHKFGYIEKENGQWLVKLNAEILFTSSPYQQ